MNVRDVTVCLTYYRSLDLLALESALHCINRQNHSHISEVIVVDNNTEDTEADVRATVRAALPDARLLLFKHGDPSRTHAWSTNVAVSKVHTPWVLFCRADYLLSFTLVDRFLNARTAGENVFVTSNGYHLRERLVDCGTQWRTEGPEILEKRPGDVIEYTEVDTGVWLMRKNTFESVGGLDERLTAWGHAQTVFQHRLWVSGVRFVRIPFVLFYHPWHGGERDLALAHKQLASTGTDLQAMWQRAGVRSPYQ